MGQTAYISFTSILPSNVTQNFGLGGNQTSAYNVVIELERDGAVLDTQLVLGHQPSVVQNIIIK